MIIVFVFGVVGGAGLFGVLVPLLLDALLLLVLYIALSLADFREGLFSSGDAASAKVCMSVLIGFGERNGFTIEEVDADSTGCCLVRVSPDVLAVVGALM